jgi:hypothetical protein
MGVNYPTCPHCGNLCGRLARLCSDCGAFLYEPNLDDRVIRDKLHPNGESRWTPPPKGEATAPRKGQAI